MTGPFDWNQGMGGMENSQYGAAYRYAHIQPEMHPVIHGIPPFR
jgi:hypothetical protein